MENGSPVGAGTVLSGTKPVKQKKHPAKAAHATPFPPSLRRRITPVAERSRALKPAMIVLANLYEDVLTKEYEDATAIIGGILALTAHHPGLRDYHSSLVLVDNGDKVLNDLYGRVGVTLEAAKTQPPILTRLAYLYETAMGAEYPQAIRELSGARDLIAHHPDLRNYHMALGWIVAGHESMLDFCRQVRAL